jgi:tetratricopeptide (TPR) repeat protein
MRPKDYELHLEISDCLVSENFESEALVHLRKAVEMTRRLKPDVAQGIQQRIIGFVPGDLSERRTFAELLESANWTDKASDAWKTFAEINRKVGKTKESARSIERALTLRENWETRIEAAQARFESNEPRKALEHLQSVYKEVRNEPKILALLATGLGLVGHESQAKQLWLEAAKRYDDVVRKSAAFEEAKSCGATEEELGDEFQDIFNLASAVQMRLHTREWANPQTKVELRFVIKARLFLEFNRPNEALQILLSAEGLENRPSIFAHLVESMLVLGSEEEAIAILQDFKHSDSSINEDVQLRLLGLGLKDEDSDELDDDLLDDDLEELMSESDEDSSSVDELEIPSSSIEQLLESAEEQKNIGMLDKAFDLLNQVLDIDPTNSKAIEKMSAWASMDPGSFTEPSSQSFNLPQNQPTFSTPSNPFAVTDSNPFNQGSIDTNGPLHLRSQFTRAYQYQLVGSFKEAENLLLNDASLEAGILLARQWIQQDKLRKAIGDLQDRIDNSSNDNPSLKLAFWEIARAYSLQQRIRSTIRTLDEIEAMDPTFKSDEIQLWREALQLLD